MNGVIAFDRLVDRLRDEGHDIPRDLAFHRTYAGRVQRERGAWSWFATGGPRGVDYLASFDSLSSLLASKEPLVLATGEHTFGTLIVYRAEDA